MVHKPDKRQLLQSAYLKYTPIDKYMLHTTLTLCYISSGEFHKGGEIDTFYSHIQVWTILIFKVKNTKYIKKHQCKIIFIIKYNYSEYCRLVNN